MGVSVLDKQGKGVNPLMGCYGIGVGRLMASAIEQHHDENGIIWPKSITPYQVYIISFAKSKQVEKVSEDLYQQLINSGVEVLLDDRKISLGVKFKDADLVGIPLRIIVGEKTWNQENKVELSLRSEGEKKLVSLDEVLTKVKKYYE